jgi:hypothetical protein
MLGVFQKRFFVPLVSLQLPVGQLPGLRIEEVDDYV